MIREAPRSVHDARVRKPAELTVVREKLFADGNQKALSTFFGLRGWRALRF